MVIKPGQVLALCHYWTYHQDLGFGEQNMVEELRPEVHGSVRADPPQVILHFVCNSYILKFFFGN